MSSNTPSLLAVEHDPFAGLPLAAFVPITESQREVWIASQISTQLSLGYNEGLDISLRGALDVAALKQALQTVIDRHEALRASFSPDGEHLMIRAELPLPLNEIDLTQGDAAGSTLAEIEATEMGRDFDLVEGPLLRFTLVRTAATEHHLLFIAHHLICDGWSGAVVLTELGALYSAAVEHKPLSLPVAPRYGDYALIERAFHHSELGHAHEAYWLNLLKAAPLPPSPPADRVRPAERSFRAERIDLPLDAGLVKRLRALGSSEGASLVATTLAAFAGFLHRLTGQSDLVIGLAAAGQSFHEQKMLVGHCVNLLPLRFALEPQQPFTTALRHTRGVILDAMEHQGVTFGQLLPKLQLDRSSTEQPLVAVVFNIDLRDDDIRHAGLEVGYRTLQRQGETFDLFVNLVDNNRDLLLEASYNADLYSRPQMQAFLDGFEMLLHAVVDAPATTLAALPLLSATVRSQLLAPAQLVTPQTRPLHAWFAETAARHASRIAVNDHNGSLSYAELDARANQLAHTLIEHGAKSGTLVAVFMERSTLLPVAILGILKAGGAYLPIDPATPAERIAHMLADSGALMALTETALAEKLPASTTILLLDDASSTSGQSDAAPAVSASADALAYVIYTSGSTGQPKGCLITHANASRLFTSTAAWFGFDETDVWTLFHSPAFDFSVWELFGALLHGGRLVMVPQWVAREPDKFRTLLAIEGVTVLNQTPSAFRQLIVADAAADTTLALRTVVFGGEALEFNSLAPWFARHGDGTAGRGAKLVNMYGITETTVHVTYRPVTLADLGEGSSASLIGEPIPDLSLYVLDASLQATPPGVAGEMYVGGAGVARGYLNRPELTAERFIADPHHAGQRLYKTGDLARWLPAGDGRLELEYLGRIDHQVKLRGYRIELGEIEARLAAHPGVAACTVNVLERSAGDARLVAWLVWKDAKNAVSNSELRSALRGHLPDYMLPQSFVEIASLPLTANGKLDRKALPDPYASATATAPAREPPMGTIEIRIAALWQQMLGLASVSREDRFFDLGGHSMLAVQAAASLQKLFGEKLPLRAVMMEPLSVLAGRLAGSAPMVETAAKSPPPARPQTQTARPAASPLPNDIAIPARNAPQPTKSSWLGRLFGDS
ncbi:MAG: amino acid adenylation domain-containing protein [Pseudomonadota bacterium]